MNMKEKFFRYNSKIIQIPVLENKLSDAVSIYLMIDAYERPLEEV